MACGSVVQVENAINLASLNLTRCDLPQSPLSSEKGDQASNRNKKSTNSAFRGECVHEAILFLQKEHEIVLTGLHQQVEYLQRKCDDLQFEAHLKHLTSNEEDLLRNRITELTKSLQERTKESESYRDRLQEKEILLDEEREQSRWRELKLQQQIDVSNQRVAEMKAEIARLKSQVHDLKVFSSALRTSGVIMTPGTITPPLGGAPQRQWPASRQCSLQPSKSAQLHRTSQESLDSLGGPRSLGSEEGEVGMWKEARLGGGTFSSLRKGTPRPNSSSSSYSLQPGSLPPISPIAGLSRRPSSTSSDFILPPISGSQSQRSRNPAHIRRQLRLLSAPNLEIAPIKNAKKHPS